VLICVFLFACGIPKVQSQMIPKSELAAMFDSIDKNTDWDMSGDMVWGYFFTDSDRSKLESVVPSLESGGFDFISIYLSDKESEEDPDLWWLHVQMIEVHSVDSLHERNLSLYEFAAKNGIDAYDGMDVGPVIKPGE